MPDESATDPDASWRTYLSTATRGIAGNADLRVLLAVSLLVMLITELYRKALPLYFRELAIPVAVLGIGTSIGNGLEVVASPVSGAAADEYDRFVLAAAAATSLAVALLALSVVRAPWAVVAVMAVFAVGRLSLNHAVTPAVSDALDEAFAGVGWGIRDVSIYLGSALGLGIGGVVLSVLVSVRYAFLALVPVVLVVAALLWIRRGTVDADADGENRSVREAVASLWPPSLPEVPRPAVMARFAAVTGLSNLGMGMTVFLLPLYAERAGLDGSQFLLLFSASFAVSAPLSVVGGLAADRFDRKRLYVGNFLAETLMLLAFGFVDGLPLFLVGTALYVLQTTFEPAVISFFFASFDEDESGRAWGIDGVVSKGVGVVAPTAGTLLYGVSPRSPFLVGAVALAAATVVALTVPGNR